MRLWGGRFGEDGPDARMADFTRSIEVDDHRQGRQHIGHIGSGIELGLGQYRAPRGIGDERQAEAPPENAEVLDHSRVFFNDCP